MTSGLRCILSRDLRLAMRRRGDVFNQLVFFVIVIIVISAVLSIDLVHDTVKLC